MTQTIRVSIWTHDSIVSFELFADSMVAMNDLRELIINDRIAGDFSTAAIGRAFLSVFWAEISIALREKRGSIGLDARPFMADPQEEIEE